jgi:hypothetical protein
LKFRFLISVYECVRMFFISRRQQNATDNVFTPGDYLVSLCDVCFRQNLQYLLNSSLSGVVRLFFVVV